NPLSEMRPVVAERILLERTQDSSAVVLPPDDHDHAHGNRERGRLLHPQPRYAQLPFIDQPGSGRHASESSESTGVKSAQRAGVDEMEVHLTQLGRRLI